MHVHNQGIIDVLWRGERKCLDPKGGDVDMWITNREELNLLVSKENLVEVEHVKATAQRNTRTRMRDRDWTQIDEMLQARASVHQRAWQDVETYADPRRRQSSCQRGKKTGGLKKKKEDCWEGVQKNVK